MLGIRAGDEVIEELVRSRLRIVGIVLSNIVDFLSPEMIVLGGGLTDAFPKIARDEVRAGIEAHSTRAALKRLRVVTAKHKGHAVTIGAGKFAIDLIKRRQHQNRGAARQPDRALSAWITQFQGVDARQARRRTRSCFVAICVLFV